MDLRSPKRTYTTRALREWFAQLTVDWEARFSSSELEEGRRLYRNGEVRAIELGEGDAIIHGRVDQEDYYAMMDWEEGRLRVRSSTTQTERGHSLAAAGLYEIEELVADEVDGIDGVETPESKNGKGTHGNGNHPPASTNGHGAQLEQVQAGIDTPPATLPATTDTSPPEVTRALLLRLVTEPGGLVLRAFWRPIEPHNGGEHPAYGKDSIRGEELTNLERETLIRLTRRAHKAGFRFDSDQSLYRLEDLNRLGAFVRKDLPEWEKYFSLEVPPDLHLIARGVQDVELEGSLDEGTGLGLNISWDLRVGGQGLSDEEMHRLLARGGEAMLLPGRGLARLRRQQSDLLNDLREVFQGEPPRYMLFSLFARDAVQLSLSPPLEAWRAQLTRVPEETAHLPTLLRDYQRLGVNWLHHLASHDCGALLADEMGLGKTLQVLSLLDTQPHPDKPALVVCPASVVPVWIQEMERFFPHMQPEVLRTGNDFNHKPEARLWLSSYTQLRRHKHLLASHEFGYAILDEAQTIKNPEAKVSQACISLKAQRRIALTGTPVENRPSDLWTLFRFLMPGLLGTRRRFERALDADREAALDRLRQQINPFILRRTKKEVAAELPPKVVMELACPLTDRQRAEYRRLTKEGRQNLGNDMRQATSENAIGLFTLLTRLRQTCCDPGLLPWVEAGTSVEHSGKITALMTKLEEVLSNGSKAVIFSQFVKLLDRLRPEIERRFPEHPIFELTGQTTDRATPVKQFQRTRSAATFLVSLRAGGTGITLTAADYVFLMDPWWNPAVEEQAIDRVHRIGQKKSVFVYRLIAHGTLEERIQHLKADKRALYDRLVEEGRNEDWSGFFASLDELIALTPQGASPEDASG